MCKYCIDIYWRFMTKDKTFCVYNMLITAQWLVTANQLLHILCIWLMPPVCTWHVQVCNENWKKIKMLNKDTLKYQIYLSIQAFYSDSFWIHSSVLVSSCVFSWRLNLCPVNIVSSSWGFLHGPICILLSSLSPMPDQLTSSRGSLGI